LYQFDTDLFQLGLIGITSTIVVLTRVERAQSDYQTGRGEAYPSEFADNKFRLSQPSPNFFSISLPQCFYPNSD